MCAGLAIAAPAGDARSHDPFEITTDAHVIGHELRLHTTMSLATAARACFPGDPRLLRNEADFAPVRPMLESCALAFYRLTAGDRELPVAGAPAVALSVEGDIDMVVAYPRPSRSPLLFDAVYLRRLVPHAGVLLTATGVRTVLGQKLLRPDDARLEVPITAEAELLGTPPLPAFGSYLALGFRHILSGYDHLLFLVGVLVVCRRPRTVAAIVTCFTAAHSVTLALAALGVVSLPARIVEPLIAATIVLVGVENLLRGAEPRGRWALTFVFGLVHGLGFASALRDAGLGAFGSSIAVPLIAFNLGVELGQLAVAIPLVALLWKVRARPVFLGRVAKVVSLMMAAVALAWLCQAYRV